MQTPANPTPAPATAITPQSVGMPSAPKPALTTSEFWLIAVAIALIAIWTFMGAFPPSVGAFVTMILPIAWAMIRAKAKDDHNTAFNAVLQTILSAGATLPAIPPGTQEQDTIGMTALNVAAAQSRTAAGSSDTSRLFRPGAASIVLLLCSVLALNGCVGGSSSVKTAAANVDAFQNNPNVQNVETGLFDVGIALSGNPSLAFLAGPAVQGLTVATNVVTGQPNPTAISGTNVTADASAVKAAVAAAIPTTQGKSAATAAANAYATLMTSPGVKPSPATANQALLIVGNALTAGSSSGVSQASVRARLRAFAALSRADRRNVAAFKKDEKRIYFSTNPRPLMITIPSVAAK